jgi:hypothetical protein
MSFARRNDNDPSAMREISAEASSELRAALSYDELWSRPARPAARALPEPRRDRAPIIATLVAVILGAAALIAMRERIVRILPPTATAFRALGMPVNLVGLELRDVRSRIAMDGVRRVLVTEGEIVNVRRERTAVPAIALAVRGSNGLDRYSWTTPAPKARLEPGEKIAFRARLASPPEDGADVLVHFTKLESGKSKSSL